MARILYAVNGEGMGHAVRSKVVIRHLLEKKHKLTIVAGGRAFNFLFKNFRNVYDILCYNIVYRNNRVMNIETAIMNVKKFPEAYRKNFARLKELIEDFRPELVITDFEPFSNIVARRFKIPVIAIDNIFMMHEGKIKIPLRHGHSFLSSSVATKFWMRIKADRHIITTFFYPELKNPRKTALVPPVLREEILNAKPSKGKHIVVYQTSATNKKLIDSINKLDEKFLVYGFDAEKKEGNVTFRKFDERQFIKDLASCRAIIVNGGFTVISEAIYLHKPILSIPVRNQFEQILNAMNVEKLGYGKYCRTVDIHCINEFLRNLPEYEKNLAKYRQEGNKQLFERVDRTIKEILEKSPAKK